MAVSSALHPAVAALFDTLAQTPSQQLAILVTQHAALPTYTTQALQVLASRAVERGAPSRGDDRLVAQRIVNVLRRLIERGDPSQARRLVPSQASLVDLALCVDARDVVGRLMDKTNVDEAVGAAIDAWKKTAKRGTSEEVARSSFVLSRILFSLPIHEQPHSSSSQRRINHSTTSNQSGSDLDLNATAKLLALLKDKYITTSDDEQGSIDLKMKVGILDATWALLHRFLETHPKTSPAEVDRLLTAIHDGTRAAKTPLVDMSLLADVAIARPLTAYIRRFAPQSKLLNATEQQVRYAKSNFVSEQNAPPGPAWARVMREMGQEEEPSSSQQQQADSTVGRGVSEEVLETIIAILPHWEDHKDLLVRKLSEPPYAGQSNDMIVQMLMDEGEAPLQQKDDVQQRQPQRQDDPMELLRQRANVFDDQPIDNATTTVLRGKGKVRALDGKAVMGTGLSDDLKASILTQVDALEADEEDRVEWDPFADRDEDLEVGFEEELDDDEGEDTSRRVPSKAGYGSGTDTEDEDAEGEASHDAAPPAPGAGAVADRASERILITAWKEMGKEVFDRDARKTKQRNALLTRLSNANSAKRWDDQLVESWGTMFGRNPRKDQILASADDLLRTGNPNRTSLAEDGHGGADSSARAFGPDRGRGGRVLTGAGRGTGSGGGRGRGRGRGGARGKSSHHRGTSSRGGGAGTAGSSKGGAP